MSWYNEAVFYHIYPLGLAGAPKQNEYGEPVHRLNTLLPWIDHIKEIGCPCRFLAVCRKFFDKSLAALRVSVTTVHEAVDECIVDAVFFGDVAKFEKMNH